MTRPRVPFKRIGLAEAQTLALDPEACILDVRHAEDFLRAHIPGAQKISIANLSTALSTTPKRTPILIYCYHGHASQEYAQIFSDFGFLAVYSLDGGFEAWSHAPRAHHRVQNDLLDQWLGHQGLPTGNATTPLMRAAHNGAQTSSLYSSPTARHSTPSTTTATTRYGSPPSPPPSRLLGALR